MDYESALNEPRTNAEQSETGDDFRVSFESRLPCHVHQLQPNADYTGFCDVWDDEEARVIFAELFKRFHLLPWDGIQLPPTGLPGFAVDAYERDSKEAALLMLGMRYLKAIVCNERRAMHLRWQEAGDFIRQIRSDAEDEFYLEQARRAMAEEERREAVPQFVYFIGSQSGPIKIGIATRPKNRLKELQTSHHERLEILAVCDGDMELERAYHARYAARRLTGEWFERCPEIEAEIERLKV